MGILKNVAAVLLLASSTASAQQPQDGLVALRVVHDAQRNHLWLLQRDGAYLLDAKTHALKQRFDLPGWVYVNETYTCGPDIALDVGGAAIISSNILPVLWRVDPQQRAVSKHDLVLDADTDKDVGFTGLVYSPEQGVFFAVSGIHGSLWRIDPLLRRAQKIPSSAPIANACGLAMERTKTRRTVVLCAGTVQNGWAVHLTPDQRSAYVGARSCAQESTLQSRLP